VEKSRQILQDSSAEGILPAEIYQLWDAARISIIPLVPSAKAGVNDATNQALRVAAAAGIQAFYDKFRDLVSGFDKFSHNEMRGKFASVKIYINPFFSARDYREFSERLKKVASGSDWLDVFEDFKTASHRLFSYVATKYQNQARVREIVDLPAARQKIADTLQTIGPSLEAGTASAEDVKRTADLLDDFYANLRTATAPLDHEAHTHAGKGSMGSTTYTASHFSDKAAYELRAGVRAARTDPDAWKSVIEGFKSSAGAVQTYLADAKRPGFSQQAEQLLLIGGVSAEVDAILRKHPDAIKVPAVFYPQAEADYVKNQDFDPVKGIPLYFYLYKDGKNWEMIDVTTPLKAKVNSADSLPNGQPDPHDLLPKLDSILRFPEGLLYVRFPDGHYWTQKTTARRTLSQWFTYIGLALGAAALGAATMGAGTAATILFFGSAVYGIAAASLDMYEKAQQGLLTVKDGIIDVAQIVSEVFGFTALTAGKIMRATTVAELGLLAEKVFVPSVKIKVAAQGVALIAMNLKTIDELNDIDNAGGSEEDRKLAKARVTSSALTTTAMVIMSMEGDIADFQGRNLYIDKDFAGRALARPLRQDVHLFEQAEKTIGKGNDLEALLARKNIPENLLTRIRGEVDYALDAGKIPKDRLRGIVSKLNNAPDATKAAEVLAELRYANRLTYSGELARDSQVITGVKAKPGATTEQTFPGGRKVGIEPVSEADAFYLGKDSKVHLDEVKNTTNALRDKLTETPDQLEKMALWRAGGPDREIAVSIESQDGWTNVFGSKGKEKAVLTVLIEENIPLRIGPYKMDAAKMQELWDKTLAKAIGMNMPRPGAEFFANMPTLADAEKFLGIKF
jgi:hypothetical protein